MSNLRLHVDRSLHSRPVSRGPVMSKYMKYILLACIGLISGSLGEEAGGKGDVGSKTNYKCGFGGVLKENKRVLGDSQKVKVRRGR